MCSEVADSDHSGSKEVKERRARTTSTVYTVDASEKTSMNGLAVNYCDDQSPLSTLDVTGRRKKTSAAAAVAAWRSCSTVQSDIDARSPPSPRPANNECLRRPETSSAAEVIIGFDSRGSCSVVYCRNLQQPTRISAADCVTDINYLCK